MRIGIREQLALLVALAALLPLTVIAIAVWVNNYNFVVDIQSSSLSLTALLKAGEIAADIVLIQSTCQAITTRLILQNGIQQFYQTNGSASALQSEGNDLLQAMESGGLPELLQVTLFSKNTTGNPHGILNITSENGANITLPYTYPNGTQYHLGDPGLGYPPQLFPNITYTRTNERDPLDNTTDVTLANAFPDFPLNSTSTLLLGPIQVNSTYAIFSLTIPILDTGRRGFVLGFLTAVASASSMIQVVQSREGLGDTGIVLLVGPDRQENHFSANSQPANGTQRPSMEVLANTPVRYIFPPGLDSEQTDRHSQYTKNISMFGSSSFEMGRYPALLNAFGKNHPEVNNAGCILNTKNEDGSRVSVGFARPQINLVDWLLVVELAEDEAWSPIVRLRNIILACVFGTVGLIILVIVPMAHFGVRPIRRLRDATEKTVSPPGYSDNSSLQSDDEGTIGDMERSGSGGSKERAPPSFLVRLRRIRRNRRRQTMTAHSDDHRRRVFRIPGKVPERKHWITDELTELTSTFNAMSDELLSQYSILEEKVAERTQQLEISKKAAEAANESKTLFIANISHELKTPLNGILGMCAVCMGEDDLPRIKKSLQIVYKSGDLLLHLLDDVLTFSKNQIGQQLNLEEKEFRLVDIKSQIVAIFDKQAREGNIDLSVKFIGSDAPETASDISPPSKPLPALAPGGIGRLKDLCLWGDQYRILQVMINLVSNSLKFTPKEGRVQVRIKCLGEAEASSEQSRISIGSKPGSGRGSRNSRRNRDGSQGSSKFTPKSANGSRPVGTALLINPMEPTPRFLQMGERPSTPPPPGAKVLMFEFEVEDSGPGIPKHLQERVFEPFVQADLGLSKKFGGTGLGLSICSQLATLMSGEISLTSTEGVGSTFTMKIPLKFVKEKAPSTSSSDALQGSQAASVKSFEDRNGTKTSLDSKTAATNVSRTSSLSFNKDAKPRLVGLSQPFFASSPPSTVVQNSNDQLQALENAASSKKKIRVLVAEDNLVNQEVVLRMLKLEDVYDVVVAKDGQEAYDMVKESMGNGQLFNLIFMDIQMPNLDGLQSTRLIRQMGYQAPIVALTAFSEESNVKECYDSGMNMFLSKPIRRPALKHVLKTFATIPEENESTSTRRSDSDVGAPEDSHERNEEKEPVPDNNADGAPKKSTDN